MGVFVFLLAAYGCRAEEEEASSNAGIPEEDAILYVPSGLYRGELTKLEDTCTVTLESMWQETLEGIYPSLGFNGYEGYLPSDALGGLGFKIPYLSFNYGGTLFQTGKRKSTFGSEKLWSAFHQPEERLQKLQEACDRNEGGGSQLSLTVEQINSETYTYRFSAQWDISPECRAAFAHAFGPSPTRELPQDAQCQQEYVLTYRLVKECLGDWCLAGGAPPVGEEEHTSSYSAYSCQCQNRFGEVTETKWHYDPIKDPPLSPIKYTPDNR